MDKLRKALNDSNAAMEGANIGIADLLIGGYPRAIPKSIQKKEGEVTKQKTRADIDIERLEDDVKELKKLREKARQKKREWQEWKNAQQKR